MSVTPSAPPISTSRSTVMETSVDRGIHPSSDRSSAHSRPRRPFQTKTNIPSSGPAPRPSSVSVKSVRRERRPRASSVVRNGVLATDMLNIARANIQSSQARRSSERSETLKSISLDDKNSARSLIRMGSLEPEMNGVDRTRRQQSSSLLLSSPVERKIVKPVVDLEGFAEEFENDQFGFGLAEHLFKFQPIKKTLRPHNSESVFVEDHPLILDLPSTPSSQASPPEDPLSDPEVIKKIVESSRKRRPSSGRVKTPISRRVKRGRESSLASKETEATLKDDMLEEPNRIRTDFKTDGDDISKTEGQDEGSEERDMIIIPRRRPKPRTVPTRSSARLASGHQTIVGEKEVVEDLDRTPTRPKPRARVRSTTRANSSRPFPISNFNLEDRRIEKRAQSVQSLDSDDLYT